MTDKRIVSRLNLRREQREPEKLPPGPKPISEGFNNVDGSIARVVELAFNSTREKMREFTIVTREQGRLLPQLDLVNDLLHYVVEVATYRQSATKYNSLYEKVKPTQPDTFDTFIYRTAQWQKSVNGVNLHEGVNIALAEVESRQNDDKDLFGGGTDIRE